MLGRQAAVNALARHEVRVMGACHQRLAVSVLGEKGYCRNRQKSGDGPLNHCGLQHNFFSLALVPARHRPGDSCLIGLSEIKR